MRKAIDRMTAMMMAFSVIMSVGAGCAAQHTHTFNQQVDTEAYFKAPADCSGGAQYYYSCTCGEKSDQVFTVGAKTNHDFSAQTKDYLKTEANCLSGAVYYYSCIYCGKRGSKTYKEEGFGEHNFNREVADWAYVKEEATETSAPVFYKICVCGMMGEETFSSGDVLKAYTTEEKTAMMPSSLTVTLYDTATNTYGFTFTTLNAPARPVIQISKGDSLENDYKEYAGKVRAGNSLTASGSALTIYTVKATIQLEPNESYTYRAYDKYADVGTAPTTIVAKDLTSEKFSFVHVSDSQMTNSTGDYFGGILSTIQGKTDFLLHTGDIVQESKYDYQWRDMLNSNYSSLSKIPMMAIAGNHDSIYLAGTNELYEHFNYPVINGQDTTKGQYYSFVYGNAKFIMLNSNGYNGGNLDSDQLAWLVEELENNTATWTIVAIHQPMYSPGSWGSDPSKNGSSISLRAKLKSIFAQYGVDLVLQGHDHVVSRTYPINAAGTATEENFQVIGGVQYSVDPSGVIYVMNGPAGDQTRGPVEQAEAKYYAYKQSSKAQSWAMIDIDGNQLTLTANYGTGSNVGTYQKWGIKKSA